MAITKAFFSTVLNTATLIVSLALVSLSTAIFCLTSNGMKLMDRTFPSGRYEWYRGPSWDMDTKHQITLQYVSTNEHMIIAAGVISCLAGVVGVVGSFLTQKTSKPTSQKPTLSLVVIPGLITFLTTLIALIYTSVIFTTNNKGACYWENGYYPNNTLTCTRELAACNIGMYTVNTPRSSLMSVCGQTQTGRHLVAPLFVASLLMFVLGVAKFVVGRKGQNEYVVGTDERVARLQREEQ